MKKSLFLTTAVLFSLAILFQSFSIPAIPSNPCAIETNESIDDLWVRLGTTTVKSDLDRDVINITARRGGFKKMKIKVKAASLDMKKIVIHYGNGNTQSVAIRKNFSAGTESRIIDLEGNHRFVEKVVFWYKKDKWYSNKPIVTLWGRK